MDQKKNPWKPRKKERKWRQTKDLSLRIIGIAALSIAPLHAEHFLELHVGNYYDVILSSWSHMSVGLWSYMVIRNEKKGGCMWLWVWGGEKVRQESNIYRNFWRLRDFLLLKLPKKKKEKNQLIVCFGLSQKINLNTSYKYCVLTYNYQNYIIRLFRM